MPTFAVFTDCLSGCESLCTHYVRVRWVLCSWRILFRAQALLTGVYQGSGALAAVFGVEHQSGEGKGRERKRPVQAHAAQPLGGLRGVDFGPQQFHAIETSSLPSYRPRAKTSLNYCLPAGAL